MPWYRCTYRWGQTNLTEIDPIRYDDGWWREYWRRTRVQGVIVNAGGIVAYYPSKYPLHHRALYLGERDLYGEVRNPCPDERVSHSPVGHHGAIFRFVLAVEVGVALDPHHPHTRKRLAVEQVLFVLLVPPEERLGRAVLATVLVVGPYMMPPRLYPAGETLERPRPYLRLGLAAHPEGRLARAVEGGALGDEFVPSEQAVDHLSGVGVALEVARVAPPLVVKHEDLGSLADGLVVAETGTLHLDLACVHADPEAVRSPRPFRHAVIEVPDLDAPFVVPEDPPSVGIVSPIFLFRQGEAGLIAELPGAVVTVTDVVPLQPAPAVVGEPFGMAARDDLFEDVQQVLVVVGAVNA